MDRCASANNNNASIDINTVTHVLQFSLFTCHYVRTTRTASANTIQSYIVYSVAGESKVPHEIYFNVENILFFTFQKENKSKKQKRKRKKKRNQKYYAGNTHHYVWIAADTRWLDELKEKSNHIVETNIFSKKKYCEAGQQQPPSTKKKR